MLAGDGGSGGLIGYIRGILTANVIPSDCEVTLICGKELYSRVGRATSSIKTIQTNLAGEKGKDIILNKPLPKDLIKIIDNEKPNVILFLNGYIRSGLDHYPRIMVLHNQLYIDTYQLIRQGLSKLTIQLILFRYAVLTSMKRADGIIFLSDFSKEQTDQKKVRYKDGRVIPFGFEAHNRSNHILGKKETRLTKMIYISSFYPYKNHASLLKACILLKEEGYKFQLLFVGDRKNPFVTKLLKIIKDNNMEQYISFTDWVEHEKIKFLIDQTDIFIYASSIETTGYGLLEGMARGALIACSNQASFPSMLKGGGVYFNPVDIYSIKKALVHLITMDKEEQGKLREIALDNSREYSWEKAAKGHYDYLKLVALNHRKRG